MTVGEISARMTDLELREWQAYLEMEPPAVDRADYLGALQAACAFNATGRMRRPVEVKDFLPKWGGGGQQAPDEVKMRARLWANGLRAFHKKNAAKKRKAKA